MKKPGNVFVENKKEFIASANEERNKIFRSGIDEEEQETPGLLDMILAADPLSRALNQEQEAEKRVKHIEKIGESQKFEDMAEDSIYPLITSDPKKQKEFIVKISKGKLDQVFSDDAEDNKFNLKSIIQDNYI